jgi:hypothetical protein
MVLTPAQQVHVEAAFPECRADLAGYLERGVEVVVFRQTECGEPDSRSKKAVGIRTKCGEY